MSSLLVVQVTNLYSTTEQALFRLICEAEGIDLDVAWYEYVRELKTPNVVKYYCFFLLRSHHAIQRHKADA